MWSIYSSSARLVARIDPKAGWFYPGVQRTVEEITVAAGRKAFLSSLRPTNGFRMRFWSIFNFWSS